MPGILGPFHTTSTERCKLVVVHRRMSSGDRVEKEGSGPVFTHFQIIYDKYNGEPMMALLAVR